MTQPLGRSGSLARAAIEDVGALVGIGYIGQIATFILSVVLRRVLGPSDVGWVALLGLAAAYAPYLGLGTLQAAERLIALEIGRGDPEAADDIEGTAAVIVGFVSLILVVAATAIILTVGTGPAVSRAVGAVVVTVIIQQVASLAIIRLRTRLRFRAVAVTTFATALLTSAGGVIGAVVGDLPGAIVGTMLGYALGAAILARVGGLALSRVRAHALRRVVAGAPSFLALGTATILLYTLDQLIAGAALGAAAFGLYTTAYLGNAFLVRIPANISSALYPRLQISFGRGSEVSLLVRQAWRATMLSGVVVGLLVGGAIIALPVGLKVVLPAYGAAIPAMRLVLLAVMGLVLAGPPSQLLVSLGRQWVVVILTAVAAGVILAGSGLAAAAQVMGIEAIALVDCLAYLSLGVGLQVAIGLVIPVRRSALAQVAIVAYGPPVCALAVASWLDGWAGEDPLRLAGAAATAAAVLLIGWVTALVAVARSDAELRSDLLTTLAVVANLVGAVIPGLRRGP